MGHLKYFVILNLLMVMYTSNVSAAAAAAAAAGAGGAAAEETAAHRSILGRYSLGYGTLPSLGLYVSPARDVPLRIVVARGSYRAAISPDSYRAAISPDSYRAVVSPGSYKEQVVLLRRRGLADVDLEDWRSSPASSEEGSTGEYSSDGEDGARSTGDADGAESIMLGFVNSTKERITLSKYAGGDMTIKFMNEITIRKPTAELGDFMTHFESSGLGILRRFTKKGKIGDYELFQYEGRPLPKRYFVQLRDLGDVRPVYHQVLGGRESLLPMIGTDEIYVKFAASIASADVKAECLALIDSLGLVVHEERGEGACILRLPFDQPLYAVEAAVKLQESPYTEIVEPSFVEKYEPCFPLETSDFRKIN